MSNPPKASMKLIRQITAGKYTKWSVTLPNDAVMDMGWKPSEELDVEVQEDSLVLRRRK